MLVFLACLWKVNDGSYIFSGALASCRHPKPGQFMTKKENIPSIVSADSADMALDSEYNCSPLIFLPFLAKWETLPSREVEGVS